MLFLCREVSRNDLDLPIELVWAKRPSGLATVLTRETLRQVIAQLTGVHRSIVQILYGSGLRLTECMGLRVAVQGLRWARTWISTSTRFSCETPREERGG